MDRGRLLAPEDAPSPVPPRCDDSANVAVTRPHTAVFVVVLVPMAVLTLLAADCGGFYTHGVAPGVRAWVNSVSDHSAGAGFLRVCFPRCGGDLFGAPPRMEPGLHCVLRSIGLYGHVIVCKGCSVLLWGSPRGRERESLCCELRC